MEGENEYNELIESGKIQRFKSNSSSINHVIVKQSSSRKVRQRNITTVNHKISSEKEGRSSDVNKTTSEHIFDSTIEHGRNEKNLLMNGTRSHEKMVINASGKDGSSGKDKEQYQSADSTWASTASRATKSAYEIYKAAGDWWNVFPKTDYTYSKSSTCRKEIAPGVLPMPNMSRRSLRRSLDREGASARTSMTSSRFYRSDYVSDDDDDEQHYRLSSTSISETKRSVITRIFISIWTYISHVFSAVTLRQHHLGLKTPPPVRSRDVQRKSWFHKLEVMYYKSACYILLLDVWFLSLFRRSQENRYTEASGSNRSKYLFLLLIPPLILAGWWFASAVRDGETSLIPSSVLPSSMFSEDSWSFFKMENLVLKSEEPLHDIDAVVQRLLSSSDFQNIILLQDQKRKQEILQREEILLGAIKQEQDRLKFELEEKSEMLLKQEAIYDQLLRENSDMKRQLIELGVSMKDKLNMASSSNYQQWMPYFKRVENELRVLQTDRLYLTRKIGECCKTTPAVFPSVAIEEHVTAFLSGLFDFDAKGEVKTPENLKLWVKKLFEAKEDLEERLTNITNNLNMKIDEASKKSAAAIMATVSEQMKQEFMKHNARHLEESSHYQMSHIEEHSVTNCGNCTLSLERVKEIVRNALNLYDADKTGMVDYALESGGGTVINTRCTENYDAKSPALSFLGFFFPWSYNHPRIAIQPEIQPGKCWAFRGAWGYLVIRLTTTIKISAFSMEHIPRSLSPTGNIDSAPKNFSVFGLANENDKDPLLLGKYMYDEYGHSLQMFPVQNKDAPPYQIIELRIESNHGNVDYTCLYRFRVHGIPIASG